MRVSPCNLEKGIITSYLLQQELSEVRAILPSDADNQRHLSLCPISAVLEALVVETVDGLRGPGVVEVIADGVARPALHTACLPACPPVYSALENKQKGSLC